jgi:hypothetical protein
MADRAGPGLPHSDQIAVVHGTEAGWEPFQPDGRRHGSRRSWPTPEWRGPGALGPNRAEQGTMIRSFPPFHSLDRAARFVDAVRWGTGDGCKA